MTAFEWPFAHLSILSLVAFPLGILGAVFAVWRSRTPQGATAWAVGLLCLPLVTLPLFLIFGRSKFLGYAKRRKDFDARARGEVEEIEQIFRAQIEPGGALEGVAAVVRPMAQPGFTNGNSLELLTDSTECYPALLRAIESARSYILFQFYVLRSDATGQMFADALIARARAGVRVWVLYDKIGSRPSRQFLKRLREGGVTAAAFQSTRGRLGSRWQINFRNHRKNVVVDGEVAFVGGLNIGDDYRGLDPKIGPWRDTHLCVRGPAAVAAQFSFLKDWYWAKRETLDLDWTPRPQADGHAALVLHTGPADEGESALLAALSLVGAARKRIWIANPYFVPPESLAHALALAALRGIEVKVLLPRKSDNHWVDLASEDYQAKLSHSGVQFFTYGAGFPHQKVLLVDDTLASVGSTNMDCRSLFINFEIGAVSGAPAFVRDVATMLTRDFAHAEARPPKFYQRRTTFRRFYAKAVGLAAPML